MQADAMELWNGVINIFKDAADTFLLAPSATEIDECQETDEKLFKVEADALASSCVTGECGDALLRRQPARLEPCPRPGGDSAKQALAGRQWLQDRNKSWIERNQHAKQRTVLLTEQCCAAQARLQEAQSQMLKLKKERSAQSLPSRKGCKKLPETEIDQELQRLVVEVQHLTEVVKTSRKEAEEMQTHSLQNRGRGFAVFSGCSASSPKQARGVGSSLSPVRVSLEDPTSTSSRTPNGLARSWRASARSTSPLRQKTSIPT